MAWQTWSDVAVDTVVTHTMLNTISTDLKQTMPALSTAQTQWFAVTSANTIGARLLDGVRNVGSTGTNSTSYTTLASGPAVSLVTGRRALVLWNCLVRPSSGTAGFVSYKVSGASTQAAADTFALQVTSIGDQDLNAEGMFDLAQALSSGTNTFTQMYRSSTSGSTCVFDDKEIAVVPF